MTRHHLIATALGMGLALSAGTGIAAEPPRLEWTVQKLSMPKAAVYVEDEQAIFLTNMGGYLTGADGDGFISRIAADGRVLEREWMSGFDNPRGIAYLAGRLYVADLHHLIEIDVAEKQIVHRYTALGVSFLNAIVVDERAAGARVFVSDTRGDAIWRLENGTLTRVLQDKGLDGPNGLAVDGETLVIGAQRGARGRLLRWPLAGGAIADVSLAGPIGSLDGVLADVDGGWWVGDGLAKVWRVDAAGKARTWLNAPAGTGNLGLVRGELLLVPIPKINELRAYPLQAN